MIPFPVLSIPKSMKKKQLPNHIFFCNSEDLWSLDKLSLWLLAIRWSPLTYHPDLKKNSETSSKFQLALNLLDHRLMKIKIFISSNQGARNFFQIHLKTYLKTKKILYFEAVWWHNILNYQNFMFDTSKSRSTINEFFTTR